MTYGLQEHKERACAGLRKFDELEIEEPFAFLCRSEDVDDELSIAGVPVVFTTISISGDLGTWCPVLFIPVWRFPQRASVMRVYLRAYEEYDNEAAKPGEGE